MTRYLLNFILLNSEINKTRPQLRDPTIEIVWFQQESNMHPFFPSEKPLFESKYVAISLITVTNLPFWITYLKTSTFLVKTSTNLHIFLFYKKKIIIECLSVKIGRRKFVVIYRRFFWIVILTKWTSVVVGVVMTICRLTKPLLRLVDFLSVQCVLSSRYLQTYFPTSYF